MSEQWRSIFDGFYSVSNEGRVRRDLPGNGTHPGRILKGNVITNGYRQVCVSRKKHPPKMALIHVLVAESFLGPRPD